MKAMKKIGFTLIELLVVIAIIAMLLAILMPALNKVKKIAQRVICGTNLKGLGTAQTVYASDYDDEYVVAGRGYSHTWSNATDGWENKTKDWSVISNLSIGASLYLLVREADVAPKSFVCPASEQQEFNGKNPYGNDIVDLWDFGHWNINSAGVVRSVSYAYHMPYAAYQTSPTAVSTGSKSARAADARRSAAFAMMADMNPWFDNKLTNSDTTELNYMDHVQRLGVSYTDYSNLPRWTVLVANAYPHSREGQNVLYADGHNAWETRSDVGVKNDNIYTRWTIASPATTELSVGNYNRRGTFGSSIGSFAALTADDSVLINDAWKSSDSTFTIE